MGILELKDVRYQYRNPYQTVEALRGVSHSFGCGMFYALVGASGSGKSTLLSLMAGLDLPTGGEITFDGQPTSGMDLNRYRRENVAVIYQSFHLLPLLTVQENVMYPMELIGAKAPEAREKAKMLVLRMGLEESQLRRYPSMLSGGERQRVAIARALGTPARVILADEPTGNLDSENTRNVMNILLRLAHEEGYCVIVVTHDPEVASMADEVVRMVDGKLE